MVTKQQVVRVKRQTLEACMRCPLCNNLGFALVPSKTEHVAASPGSSDYTPPQLPPITRLCRSSPFLPSTFFLVTQRTMVSQLVKHERIDTTVTKAKEVRRLVDNMVQLGKEGSLCAARRAAAFVRGDDVLHKLFTELAYRYKDRAGGYTRLVRTRIQVGDAAPMAYIEFIDRENELRQAKPPTPQQPQRAPLDPWTRSRLTRQFAPPKVDKSQDS